MPALVNCVRSSVSELENDQQYLGYGSLGAATSAEYDNALYTFRAYYPLMMGDIGTAAAKLEMSSDPSNRAEGARWKSSLIPQLQQWGAKILNGDLTNASRFVTTTRQLLAAAKAWVDADPTSTERVASAVDTMITTSAKAVGAALVETAKKAGEVGGALVGGTAKGVTEAGGSGLTIALGIGAAALIFLALRK